MGSTVTVRVMSPEEIAAKAGGETPYLHWPQRSTLFAEREMRLRQLAPGHSMQGFLHFVADLAHAQHVCVQAMTAVPVPDAAALDGAARRGEPALAAVDWPRDPAWRNVLRCIAEDLQGKAPDGARAALQSLAQADDDWLERQADCLLTGVMQGLDLAASPIVAAALQVYWAHLVLSVHVRHRGTGEAFGRLDDAASCPACGSRPTASLTRSAGDAPGQRYLHCSLCSLQWHMVRIKCTHCGSTEHLAYQSLDALDASTDDSSSRAAQAAVQAETCEDCRHYLKIMHSERDPFVDPVADDLASLTLDLLVSDAGAQRHGVNLLLLFGEPEAPPDPEGP